MVDNTRREFYVYTVEISQFNDRDENGFLIIYFDNEKKLINTDRFEFMSQEMLTYEVVEQRLDGIKAISITGEFRNNKEW